MTIKDIKEYATTSYEAIMYGSVIFYPKTGWHYLAIPEVDDRTKPKIYNSFNLDLNKLEYIEPKDEVIARQAELHLI